MAKYVMAVILCTGISLSGCIHPQVKYQKMHHLDPLMDPAKSPEVLPATMRGEAKMGIEKGSPGTANGLGSSCPTCGY